MKKIYSFDFLRLFLTVCIVLYHINFLRGPVLKQGYLAVEVFFVLSGFLLVNSYFKYNTLFSDVDLLKKIIFNKAKRLYPEYLFMTFLACIIYTFLFDRHGMYKDIFYNLIMYGHLGLSANIVAGSWFVGALFWGSLIIGGLLIKYKETFFILTAPFCFLFSVFLLYQYSNTSLMMASNLILNIFPAGLLRAIAGLSVGMISYYIYYHKWYENKIINIITLSISLIFFFILCTDKTADASVYNIYFFAAFIVLGSSVSDCYLERFCKNKFIICMSNISYMVFLSNILVINIFEKYLPYSDFMNKDIYQFLIFITCYVIAGILFYIQKWLFIKLKHILFVSPSAQYSESLENLRERKKILLPSQIIKMNCNDNFMMRRLYAA